MSRPPQPTPWSCTGRQRSPKPTSFTAASALSGDRHTAEASAEAVGSWIGRLSHHRMTPCELWDAQSPARRPHRLVRRFRCVLGESARRGSQERFRRPLATGTRPRRRLRWSAHGSGDCPTTAWYRVSSGMLKLPPVARTDACRVSDAKSSCTLAAAAGNARGSAVTVTTSAEVVGSSIGRLSHHRMMSGSVCDGLELVRRP